MRLGTVVKIVAAVVVLLVAAAVVALLTVDFSKYKGEITRRVTEATGRNLVISGDFKLNLFPLPAVAVKGVSFANASWGTRPEMAKVGELDAEVAVLPLIFGGNVQVKQLVLKDVDLLIETDAKGRGNWEFGEAGKPPAKGAAKTTAAPAAAPSGAPALPEIEKLSFENIAVTYRDGVSKKTTRLLLNKLTARSAGGTGPLSLDVAASYNDVPVKVAAKLGAIADLMAGGKPFPVDATVTVADAVATLKGKIAHPLQGRGLDLAVAFDAKDLKPLSPLAGGDLPAGKPVALKAVLTGDADKVVHLGGVQASFGATQLAGEASVAMGGARPRITAKLTAPMIDVTEFAGGEGGEGKAAAGGAGGGSGASGKAGKQRVFSDAPLDLKALGTVDADITLNAAHIKSEAATLDDAMVHLVLNDRDLRLKPLSGVVNGNRFAGDVALAARQATPALTVNLDAKQLNVGALLQQATGKDLMDAKGDLAVAVKGAGKSVAAIMGSLDGQTSLVVGAGTLKTNYTDLLAADVVSQAMPWAKNASDNKLNCIVSRFDIRDGLATSRGLLFDSSQVTMQGEGTIDLGKETLDLLIRPQPKQASLVSLAVPIRVGGTLANPRVIPDPGALAKGVAGAVIGGAINPLGVLVPLVSSGSSDQNPCLAALQGGAKASSNGKAAPAAKPATPVDEIKGFLKSLPFGGK